MSGARKLTPEEILLEVERMEAEEQREAEDRAIDAVLAKSPEEVRRDLQAAGVDLDKQRALAEAVQKRFASLPTEPAKVVSLTPRRRATRLVWLAAAAIVVASAAYAARTPIVRLFSHQDQVPPNNPSPAQLADRLCDEATDACRKKSWDECETLLNEAVDKHLEIQLDDRYVRARWAIAQARTVDSNLPWLDKPFGPGLHPRAPTDKPPLPR